MEQTAHSHLHRATLRILHSHSFNSSSSVAAHTLTSLFASYLDLLAQSSVARANNSGRIGVGWGDVLGALDEMGVGVEEIMGWCKSEAGEVGRKYVVAPKEREVYGVKKEEGDKAKMVGRGRGVLGVSSWQANGLGVSVGPVWRRLARRSSWRSMVRHSGLSFFWWIEADWVGGAEYVSDGLVRDPSSGIHWSTRNCPRLLRRTTKRKRRKHHTMYSRMTRNHQTETEITHGATALAHLEQIALEIEVHVARSNKWHKATATRWLARLRSRVLATISQYICAPTCPNPDLTHQSCQATTQTRGSDLWSDIVLSLGPCESVELIAAFDYPTCTSSSLNANPTLGTVIDPAVALREAMATIHSIPHHLFLRSPPPRQQTRAWSNPKRREYWLVRSVKRSTRPIHCLAHGEAPRRVRVGLGERGVPVLLDQQGEMMVKKKGAEKAVALISSGVGGRVVSREEDVGGVMGRSTFIRDLIIYQLILFIAGYFKSPILPLATTFITPGVLHRTTRILPPPPLRTAEDADSTPLYYHLERAVPAPWSVHVPEADGGPVRDDTSLPDARLVPTWDWVSKSFEADVLNTRRGRGMVGGVAVGNQGRAGSVAGA
ncbi:bromodomain associated protein [Ceratobasidium sp. AG-Ba]|nr:bromodomain associated protein [Ceratobasidium sp. AG-Ba]